MLGKYSVFDILFFVFRTPNDFFVSMLVVHNGKDPSPQSILILK